MSVGLKKYSSASAWAARGQRQHKDFAWALTAGGKKITFAELQAQIAKAGGIDIDGRLPALPVVKAPDGVSTIPFDPNPLGSIFAKNSQLLNPIETASSLRQPNLLFIRTGGTLRIYDTAKGTDLATNIQLPNDANTVLVGVTKDTAVLMQVDAAIFLDLKNGSVKKQTLKTLSGAAAGSDSITINGNRRVIGSDLGIEIIDTATGQLIVPNSGGGNPDNGRRAAFAGLSGGSSSLRFNTARILNGNLIILAANPQGNPPGNQLQAFNIQTAEPAYIASLPPGAATAVIGNEDMLVAQVDAPDGSSTFCALDSQSGHLLKRVKVVNERVAWSGLGEDGTLIVTTNQAISAYDMVAEQNGMLWQRKDIGARFAGASALTLDGLVVVSDTNDALCLALDSGENRWQAQFPVVLVSSSAGASPLRSAVEGDLVIFQSENGSAAFRTMPVPDRQSLWKTTSPTNSPPRQSMQLADGLLVEFMSGQTGPNQTNLNASRTNLFVVYDRKADGKTVVNRPFGSPADVPFIRSWQVLDNGIAVEVGNAGNSAVAGPGTIYFWKTIP